jgi:hypothetical protein
LPIAPEVLGLRDKRRGDGESSFPMGDYLARQGDAESATGAFRSAIAHDDPEWSPRAAYHLGELLWAARDPGGAEAALRVATDARHPEESPAGPNPGRRGRTRHPSVCLTLHYRSH